MSGRILPAYPAGKVLTGATAAPSLSELVEVIGAEAATKLCEAFGGTDRYFGRIAAGNVEVIGLEAAMVLRAHFGGERIYIPRRTRSLDARWGEVAQLRREGLTVHKIAVRVQLTERQVYKVLARLKVEKRAPSEPHAALCTA